MGLRRDLGRLNRQRVVGAPLTVGQGPLHEYLHVPPFATREVTDGGKDIGIDLGGELFRGDAPPR
jgi:hypothetical protein